MFLVCVNCVEKQKEKIYAQTEHTVLAQKGKKRAAKKKIVDL